jgi:hypothetical protein
MYEFVFEHYFASKSKAALVKQNTGQAVARTDPETLYKVAGKTLKVWVGTYLGTSVAIFSVCCKSVLFYSQEIETKEQLLCLVTFMSPKLTNTAAVTVAF